MQTSMVIESLLNHIKNSTLGEFTIEPNFVFDDSLDFRERAVQYITRNGVFEKVEGEVPSEWSIFIWTRSPIVSTDQVLRPHKAPYIDILSGASYGRYSHRLAQVDISCKIVSNSIELSETIEEHMFVLGGESVTFDVDYGELGVFTCSAVASASTNFEVTSLESNGTIVAVSFDVSITYPLLILKKEFKNIQEISSRTFANGADGVHDETLVN